jgi:hypothetical protein
VIVVGAERVLGHPGADAVVIDGGAVVAVGRRHDLSRGDAAVMSFPGGTITPGLGDAHIHPAGYAAAVTGLSLAAAADLADVVEMVRSRAYELPPGVPVVGARLDEHRLREGRLPTRGDLDAALEHRPILLTRSCGHVAVASTAALDRAGIGPSTPDPPGGSLDRDASGAPTGILRETAMYLVTTALAAEVPPPGPEALLAAVSGLAGHGITRIDAIVAADAPLWCGTAGELDGLVAIAGDLPIDVAVFTIAETPDSLRAAATALASAGGRLRWAGWKGFADGSLGGSTAAMTAPFADAAGTGTLRLDARRDAALAETALELGGTVAIHAIGDRANQAVLDLYAGLQGGWADPERLRVEHASVLSPELIGRLASTGVTASVQPAFISSEVGWLERRIGAERVRWTYPLRSMQAAGVAMVAGSDSPVESPDPWPAMAAAANNPLVPEESLGAAAAFGLFAGPTIEPGAVADLIVVDRDPTDDPAGTRVLATFKEGVRLHHSPLHWVE